MSRGRAGYSLQRPGTHNFCQSYVVALAAADFAASQSPSPLNPQNKEALMLEKLRRIGLHPVGEATDSQSRYLTDTDLKTHQVQNISAIANLWLQIIEENEETSIEQIESMNESEEEVSLDQVRAYLLMLTEDNKGALNALGLTTIKSAREDLWKSF